MDEDHYAVNRAWWDERAPAHANSPDYAVQELIADPTRLSDVVRFDLPRLGDVNGLRGIHLQCHIGTDTISLHRLGAAMTGLDFSPESIAIARGIAADRRRRRRLCPGGRVQRACCRRQWIRFRLHWNRCTGLVTRCCAMGKNRSGTTAPGWQALHA